MISVRYNRGKDTNVHTLYHILPVSPYYEIEGVYVYCFIMKAAHHNRWHTYIPEMVNFEIFKKLFVICQFYSKGDVKLLKIDKDILLFFQ